MIIVRLSPSAIDKAHGLYNICTTEQAVLTDTNRK